MERENFYKQELFNQFSGETLKSKRNKVISNSPGNFSIKFTPENLLFIIIGFVLVIAVSFSLGVEKGKRIRYKPRAKITKSVEQDLQEKVAQVVVAKRAPAVKQTAVKQAPAVTTKTKQKAKTKTKYTIQVVTYIKPDFAKKEMAFLSEKGYKSYLKVSGSFYVIYVGSYDNREEAVTSLKKLRKRYKDCFVKKTFI